MKRTERHRLKQNEVATWVARTQEFGEQYGRQIRGGVVVGAVLVVLIGGYAFWQRQVNVRAEAMLGEALVIMDAPVVPPAAPEGDAAPAPVAPPPAGSYPSEQARNDAALAKLLEAAAAYPSADAGIAARYYAAGLLALQGRTDEAEARYQEVIDGADDGFYGRMARLGLAETLARAGKYDAAIQIWTELSELAETDLPVDCVLMQLGHTYRLAGKSTDAVATFTRLVDEFPQSAYADQARQVLDILETPATP